MDGGHHLQQKTSGIMIGGEKLQSDPIRPENPGNDRLSARPVRACVRALVMEQDSTPPKSQKHNYHGIDYHEMQMP